MEVAFIKYDDMIDDMLGMFSICALDRDYDVHESVNQWAQGIFAKTPQEYGSVLWSSQSIPTAVDNKIDKAPVSYTLEQNYPNPFNPTTTINYTLNKTDHVTLRVYAPSGQEVSTLVNEQQAAGRYAVTFDASQLSSGVYLYQLQTPSFTRARKMTILR